MTVKLTYFNLRARGEPARLILEQAGAEYEDHRLESPFVDIAPWVAYKPSTPYGQLPVLCDNGVEIAQSMTIARYCANKYGLAGSNALENAQMDEIVDTVSDGTEKQYNAFLFEKDETKKAELQKTFNDEILPNLFKALEKRLGERGEFFAANKLSWADIIFYHFAAELPDKEVIKGYPKLDALFNKVANQPKIKSWVEKRPPSAV
jgi:glutathione S-transferase